MSPNDRIEDVECDTVYGLNLPRSRWREIALGLDTGSKTDQDQAARLRAASVFTGAAQLEMIWRIPHRGRSHTPEIGSDEETLEKSSHRPLLESEARRILPLIERRRAVVARDRTEALLHIATAAAANYRREKRERGLLDYDDLIDRTLEMLDRVSSGWVHYKLDRGVDHVLIDEAQDTSPRQWDIVEQSFPNSPRAQAPAMACCARCSRSATRSSRSSRSRARRRANSTCAAAP